MIDFVFEEYIKKEVEEGRLIILEKNPLEYIKGLTLNTSLILINLSALQWKGLVESVLLQELENTIVHESVHLILLDVETTLDSEENVCRIMAGQIENMFNPPSNRNIYIEEVTLIV